jgi:hypothetical protein
MQSELRDVERAVAAGARSAGQGLETALRRQVGSAGLGQRLANSWRDEHYPSQRLDAARSGLGAIAEVGLMLHLRSVIGEGGVR